MGGETYQKENDKNRHNEVPWIKDTFRTNVCIFTSQNSTSSYRNHPNTILLCHQALMHWDNCSTASDPNRVTLAAFPCFSQFLDVPTRLWRVPDSTLQGSTQRLQLAAWIILYNPYRRGCSATRNFPAPQIYPFSLFQAGPVNLWESSVAIHRAQAYWSTDQWMLQSNAFFQM